MAKSWQSVSGLWTRFVLEGSSAMKKWEERNRSEKVSIVLFIIVYSAILMLVMAVVVKAGI